MKRRLLAVLLGLALLVGLAACGGPDHGRILAKDYTAGHTVWSTSCVPVGKTVVCHPYSYWQGPTWAFDLEDGDAEGWTYVDESTFHAYKVGDYFEAAQS